MGDYPGHVLERHKDVIATSPHGSRHLHGGQVIERGTALGRERKSVQERKLLTASTGFRYAERRLKEHLLRTQFCQAPREVERSPAMVRAFKARLVNGHLPTKDGVSNATKCSPKTMAVKAKKELLLTGGFLERGVI